MPQPRYLTKSRYVVGLECPTKLFYTGKKTEYADQKFDDRFLQQLANGGFQVGELAKCYYPAGIGIDTLDYDEAVSRTSELLEKENVTIFEAGFRFRNLFVRADILQKRGNKVDLIEVKAKSWPPSSASGGLIGVRGGLDSGFRSKVADLAFQNYVIQHAQPEWEITPYFLFADKKSKCPTDGLHQKFRIRKDGGRRRCVTEGELTPSDLDPQILCLVPAKEACKLYAAEMDPFDGIRTFEQHIEFLAEHYERDKKVTPRFTSTCAKCEFRTDVGDGALKSGQRECWGEDRGWDDSECAQPSVLDIWNFRKKDNMIELGKFKFDDLEEADIGVKTDKAPGITQSERQWKQVTMVRTGETTHWIDRDGLRQEMKKWEFPLHFIDFETSMTAIPFKRGRRPYEGVAFQFSHHVIEEDGLVHHRGEFLESRPGVFPNYDFIRALRDELSADEGSIFRYAAHENTYVNHVWTQLMADDSVADRHELCSFIETISRSTDKQDKEWCGRREMVDMYALVKRHYFHPSCPGGSCSIKHVLPAILNSSTYLQEKYSKPLVSRNFPEGKIWVQRNGDGRVVDPYKLLEPLFTDASPKDLELLLSEEEDRGGIREGGAAMAAYLLLQFEEMSEYERGAIESGLLKYCELDTLAMVMIYEAWHAELAQ
jgi:hypothetical protein